MKKILFIIIISVLTLVGFNSCDQYMARSVGGTTTITLEPGEKLIEATWKEADLWYLTEPMDSDYIPKTKIFKESSLFGVMNGKVIFVEQK